MATITQCTCDFKDRNNKLCGQEAQTMDFNVSGQRYEVDLCEEHRNALVGSARPVASRGRPRVAAAAGGTSHTRTATARADAGLPYNVIREWARSKGMTVSDRGRPKKEVVDAWRAAS